MTLTEFLLARLAEDEAAAKAASAISKWDAEARDHVKVPAAPAIWVTADGYGSGAVERTNGDPHDVGIVVYDEGCPNDAEATHIARHDPARVLADVESKRRIVEMFSGNLHERWDDGFEAEKIGREVLRALAAVYADHPDYQEAWKP